MQELQAEMPFAQAIMMYSPTSGPTGSQPSTGRHSLSHTPSHCKEVVWSPWGTALIYSPPLPEQGAKEWKERGEGKGVGDFVSGNKNSNPASKPWVISFSSNRSVWWVNISKYGEAGCRISVKLPFSALALKEHGYLKENSLTQCKWLIFKEVVSQVFHRLFCYKRNWSLFA